MKEAFKASMGEARATSLLELTAKYTTKNLSKIPFEEFFQIGADGWASDFADHLGVGE